MSLQEVFKRIEAFKKNMKEIGVPVTSVIISTPVSADHEIAILLRTLMRKDVENLEAEG